MSGAEKYLNWSDFNRVCISRGMPPEIFATLRRAYRTYCEGGTDLTVLKWYFTRWAPWARIIPIQHDSSLDEADGQRKLGPMIMYPSKLLLQGFVCEHKADILWCYGSRGQGKSIASYGIAENWLQSARRWPLSHEFGSPRVYVYGDVNGYVPSEPGWFRCPDWFMVEREDGDFPLLEVYDEVPLALRSGAVSKTQKKWAEKLTRSRHMNVWTIMNMVQAKMASKRGREMDAMTLDRFSGLRQLKERIDDMPIRAFKDIYRKIIPEMRRDDPGLVMTQLNEDQGDAGTWITLYETEKASWFEWRESEKKQKSLMLTAAPWPPECVKQRVEHYAEPILQEANQSLGNEDKEEYWRNMLGIKPSKDNESKMLERICRHILRGAGLEWAAIGEVLNGHEGTKKEKMGGGGTLQRWGHRNKFENCNEKIKEAAEALKSELPPRNKSPVCWGLSVEVIGSV